MVLNRLGTRQWSLILVVVAIFVSGGCRLHDAGRLEIASNAVELASEVYDSSSGPFHAMTVNLATVDTSYDRMVELQFELRQETFYGGLNELNRLDVHDELDVALDTHLEIKDRIDSYIDRTLERLEELPDVGTHQIDANSATTILDSIDQMYRGLRKAITNIAKLIEEKEDSGNGKHDSTVAELTERLDNIISAAVNDQRVADATRLELEAARSAAAARQRQLVEFRRHLQELLLIQSQFAQRHRDFMEQLMLFALSHVDTDAFEQRHIDYRDRPPIQGLLDQSADWVRLWKDQNLAGYLDSAFEQFSTEPAKAESAAQLPVVLGIILFVELPADQRADVAAATAVHRHSIRLSEINARYRLQIIHELTAALNLYYEGGIKPEEVARLALAAGQVGALVGIAANE